MPSASTNRLTDPVLPYDQMDSGEEIDNLRIQMHFQKMYLKMSIVKLLRICVDSVSRVATLIANLFVVDIT